MGNPEIYYWPQQQKIMAKKADGLNWVTFNFPPNVIDIAKDPNNYP
jgi:hypothetical protein